MTFKRILVASSLVLILTACAERRYDYPPQPRVDLGPLAGGVVGQTIAAGGLAPGEGRRRLYDDRAGRWYYFDAPSNRYFWDDGSPRL